MRPKLEYLPAAESFLDPVRADAHDPGAARAVVIPFGLEASVSYGGGTAAGPAAILKASQQLELYDDELEREPYLDYGVAALRAPAIAQPIEAALDQLAAIVETVLEEGKFPFVLGGEHSLTAGAIRPLARAIPISWCCNSTPMPTCATATWASAIRTPPPCAACWTLPACRSCRSASARSRRPRSSTTWPTATASPSTRQGPGALGYRGDLAPLRGRPVYVTFDIDALDAAVMPATGTPTPGGLSYAQALAILRRACQAGRVVGADLVEFAPIAGLHACDYTAAALAYKMLSYALGPSRRAQ